MTTKVDGTNGVLQSYDYQVSTTGFSYTFAAGTTNLVMNPAGTLATGTITMPAAPSDGMTITFSSSQIITALTVNANTGQSIVGAPTSLTAGGAATFLYRLSNTTWYNQVNTNISGSAAPIVTIYSSPATWTKPGTVKSVRVTICAGGGGGIGVNNGSGSAGGGGGAAGYGYFPAPSIPGPTAVTVGAAGTAGSAPGAGTQGSGGTGGTSSFGALISATGGAGGTAAPVVGNSGPAAGGTITSGPTVLGVNGGASPYYVAPSSTSGAGGPSMFGSGGIGRLTGVATNPGNPGVGYGSGGSGAANPNAGNAPGGAGTAGFVVVEEFY